MKTYALICAMLAALATLATEKKEHQIKPMPEELRATLREGIINFGGGTFRKPGSARGVIVFLNTQNVVRGDALRPVLEEIDSSVHVQAELKTVRDVKLTNPKADIAANGGKIGVVIVDAPDLPALLTAPEDGWAVINVKSLRADNPTDEILASRTRKEMMRAVAMIGGCVYMTRGPILLRDVRSPKELDGIKLEEYCVDVLLTLESSLPSHGVIPWHQTTYRKAVQEGWAPAPTNEVQKKIWEQVHTIPDKPMKITFDPATQKGKVTK